LDKIKKFLPSARFMEKRNKNERVNNLGVLKQLNINSLKKFIQEVLKWIKEM
jgi:hypothetical protein